jgi:uncharacterized protein YecE (DUF72 family)
MGQAYIGTSGFAYAAWKPGFYPADTPASKFLSHYASKLNSTEINYTFRRLASAKTLETWSGLTPEGFRFAFKAHMRLTHSMRLKNAQEFLKRFLESLNPMAAKTGPILFQLPPNMKEDPDALAAILEAMPSIRTAWEFRNTGWFNDGVYRILERHQATLCWAESDTLQTPAVRTAPYSYMRFRNPPYEGEKLKQIADQVAQVLRDGDAYVYFKHEDSPEGALDGARLLELLNGR